MADELSDGRLEAVLISVGQHLVIPPEPEVVSLAARRPARSVRRARRLLAVAAAAAIVAGATLLVPSARTAVADLLGIGSTRIEIAPEDEVDETSLPRIVDGLASISIAKALAILQMELPDTAGTTLGSPDTIYQMPEGGVLLAWGAEDATLWVQAETADTEAIFTKLINSNQDIEQVDGIGSTALFIDGIHILQTPHRRLTATSVLLWNYNGLEYRFEADMTRVDMINFARAVE